MKTTNRVLIIPLVIISSCTTPKTWQKGNVAADPSRLTNDERMEQFTTFAIERLDAEYVAIREDDALTTYKVDSYQPVLDRFDKSFHSSLQEVRWRQNLGIFAAALSGGAAGRASVAEKERDRYIAVGFAVLSGFVANYFGKQADAVASDIQFRFNLALENHLFGQPK